MNMEKSRVVVQPPKFVFETEALRYEVAIDDEITS